LSLSWLSEQVLQANGAQSLQTQTTVKNSTPFLNLALLFYLSVASTSMQFTVLYRLWGWQLDLVFQERCVKILPISTWVIWLSTLAPGCFTTSPLTTSCSIPLFLAKTSK
jgi:hypothetical protein